MSGAIAALVGMFPAAFLFALVWKFPIPLAGYASGLKGALLSPLAVVFYGVLGGFIVVPGLGAATGALAFQIARGNAPKAQKLSVIFGLLWALAAAAFLALLDKIIGPW
ncbi:MAG: hypothetical protein A2Z19_02085 [Deltaproteobacteria bacterium RBG_16_54_18]|nr:MAG: hypothetical protein A2Z19_02085 [Deltaproteobacteria bacterium RBG_16_54_18]